MARNGLPPPAESTAVMIRCDEGNLAMLDELASALNLTRSATLRYALKKLYDQSTGASRAPTKKVNTP